MKNDVVKKAVYDKLVAKVNNIDTSGFVLKTKYDTDQSEIEIKIPDNSRLVKKTHYNVKITEIESNIPSISGLATSAALSVVENKIHFSLKKWLKIEKKPTDHNHDKYITTPEFNTLVADVFNARVVQANLITKEDFDAKLWSLKIKITTNKTKHLFAENEF